MVIYSETNGKHNLIGLSDEELLCIIAALKSWNHLDSDMAQLAKDIDVEIERKKS